MTDQEEVWAEVEKAHPEFKPYHDVVGNHHAVREIVLGGSVAWAGVHGRFQPGPGKSVLDLGANAGIYATFCGVKGANVVALEPFKELYDKFDEMIRRVGLRGLVVPVNAAVWKFTGECKYFGNKSMLNDTVPAFNGGVQIEGLKEDFTNAPMVPCISIDDVIGFIDWDCVKMDIEGAEFEVILSASDSALQRIRFMYIEFHPWISEELYSQTIEKLQRLFAFEGVSTDSLGRWEAAYLMGARA